jgi:Copper transport outer membrane protein, MctB
MINFRFHIVSLTAVLLALGIGLVLGTAFFDDATVSLLRRQLDSLNNELDAAEAENADLHRRLESLTTEDTELDEQLGERLMTSQLSGDPVLVIQPEGLEGNPEDRVLEALGQAGADVRGVWRLTGRFALDDDDEITDLSNALDLATDNVDRLRESLTQQLADVLFSAMDTDGSTPGPGIAGGPGQGQPGEPQLLARLHEEGFVDYELPEGDESGAVILPSDGLRVLVVTGEGATPADDAVLLPTLTWLTSDGSVPLVVASPVPADEEPEEGEAPPPTPLVTTIRQDDLLSERVATVDDLDRVAGRVAIVLALQDAVPGLPLVGHYGLGEGADRLLPPPPEGS